MASYVTDFSEYTSGSLPSDWTKRWNDSWTTLEVNTGSYSARLYGDLCLVMDPSATDNKFLSWDDVDSDSNRDDVEILIKVRGKDNGGNYRLINLVARGAGSTGSEDGYALELQYDNLRIIRSDNGTHSAIATKTDAIGYYGDWDGYWFFMRFRVNGSDLKGKIWYEHHPEPEQWVLETTDSNITAAGWVGVGFYQNTAGADVDFVSIATNGDTAAYPSSDADAQINLSQMFVDVAEADGDGVIHLDQMFLDVAEEYPVHTVQYGQGTMEVVRTNALTYSIQWGQGTAEIVRENTLAYALQLGQMAMEVIREYNPAGSGTDYVVVCVNN